MQRNESPFISGRRQFLLKAFPAGAFLCLGGGQLLSFSTGSLRSNFESEKHKFLTDSGMSYQEVYRFAYQGGYIPTMKKMAAKIGREKFLELLKESAAEAAGEMMAGMAQSFPKRDLATFSLSMKKPDPVFKHALTFKIVEDSAAAFEVKITECLWAKSFREADAADIGYAAICHGDFAMAKAFNPHMRMERTKTLMEGHDHCNHRWIWEA